VVQSGFPAWVKQALEDFTLGWEEIVADLAVYLKHGVRAGRHMASWASSGLVTKTVQGGLKVVAVAPGSFGERAGMQRGDLLITLGGAPMLNRLQHSTMMRACREGDEVEAVWARGRELMRATAIL
jgi:S1-C subfamily serine protease